MKFIVRLDLNNPLCLTTETGATPKTLPKGTIIVIGSADNERDLEPHERDTITQYGRTLAPVGSVEADRALEERDFEIKKSAAVKKLLAAMNCSTVLQARNRGVHPWESEATSEFGFMTEREHKDPDIVQLLALLRTTCPEPKPPSFASRFFKPTKK
jgi:hypothetical protein